MRPSEKELYEVHSRSRRFRRKMLQADEIIRQSLDKTENPYVAFSLGKDSSAMLFMVARQAPDLTTRIISSGETRLLHRNFDEALSWWRKTFPRLDIQEINLDRIFSEEWEDATWKEQRAASHGDLGREAAKGGNDRGPFDCVFMGLRREESKARRWSLKSPIHRYSDDRKDLNAGMLRACPLAYWTTMDVGALHVRGNIPMLESYEREGLAARTTLRLSKTTVENHNALGDLKRRDMQAYNVLLARFPELRPWG